MTKLRELARNFNIACELRQQEPLAEHTTFRVGGPAEWYALPSSEADLRELLALSREAALPYFVLGGGANILVGDGGFKGLVIDMSGFNELRIEGSTLIAGAGLPVTDAAAFSADAGLAGLHFWYAMPGSVGGAVWMNARCYGGEISEVLESVRSVLPEGGTDEYQIDRSQWSYKRSPFQHGKRVMVQARFALTSGDRETLWRRMHTIEADRRAKGHFAAPCAGSVFKNDRSLGKPSGALLDSIGVRGFRIGEAQVSPQHANIVINRGSATAAEIRAVIETVAERARIELGITLEREVLFVGEWR